MKTGEEISCEVTLVDADKIFYQKAENLEGPKYSMSKEKIFMIKYENGTKDVFSSKIESELIEVIEESKSIIPVTQQTTFAKKEKKKVDNFDFILGTNFGAGFLKGNGIDEVYGEGETHFRIFAGSRIKQTTLFLFYEVTNSNGHPLDEDGAQYEELTSKMSLNMVGVQASFGDVFYLGPRIATVTIKESFEFQSMEVSGESKGVLIGLNLGFATKGNLQFFGEVNLDHLSFNEEDVDEGALAKDDASFTRGSINAGIRLRF